VYLLRLDEVGEYEVNIELSKEQILDVLKALDKAKEEAQNLKEGEIQSQPKQIKYIFADHENLYKKGFVLVKRSNQLIGLTISLEKSGDIEPYFSIETCEEIITLLNRILRS
jgi:hypothetical protein